MLMSYTTGNLALQNRDLETIYHLSSTEQENFTDIQAMRVSIAYRIQNCDRISCFL